MTDYERLLDILDLEEIGQDRYRGETLDIGSLNVYGGQVVGQAVVAAYRSLATDKLLHSLHAYFLHPGDKEVPLVYEVQKLKQGRSFEVARVRVKQNDSTIFFCAASFHIKEDGISHQMAMPNVTEPEQLATFAEVFKRYNKSGIKLRGSFSEEGPFIFKPVTTYNPFNPGIRPPKIHTWFKLNGDQPIDEISFKHALTTYASDFNLLVTALLPHDMSFFKTPLQMASLDHAMWFHDEPVMDDYMLYTVESPMAADARASAHGKIFSRDGRLIATVVQEGLIRKL